MTILNQRGTRSLSYPFALMFSSSHVIPMTAIAGIPFQHGRFMLPRFSRQPAIILHQKTKHRIPLAPPKLIIAPDVVPGRQLKRLYRLLVHPEAWIQFKPLLCLPQVPPHPSVLCPHFRFVNPRIEGLQVKRFAPAHFYPYEFPAIPRQGKLSTGPRNPAVRSETAPPAHDSPGT